MNHREICENFFNNGVRVETIIHLGSMCHDYAYPSCAEDAFEQDWEEVLKALDLEIDADADKEEISSTLYDNNKLGFLIQAATPVPKFLSSSSSTHSGWGYYATKWIYAENINEAISKAHEWAEEYYQEQKVKQGFAQAS